MLSEKQLEHYKENGFLHIPQVFSPKETEALERDLEFLMEHWAETSPGWTGPWRKAYMDEKTEKASKLTALHDLHLYAESWMRAVTKPELSRAVAQLLGDNVELHHTTLHAKPPQTGHPFPMHQDYPFYEHQDGRYVDVLVHLDDTFHENGEIRFLAGSHKEGKLPHVTETPDGPCTPHLPTDRYRLEDTVPVPAKRGDVVCFNIYAIHGSYINQTDRIRRMVRVGYRDPLNKQLAGQSAGRPGVIVSGVRLREAGDKALTEIEVEQLAK